MENTFLPENLGLEHIPREAALREHSRAIYYQLFQEDDKKKMFLIMDGTYIYINKPTDFDLQKSTYSGQKLRNLLKPFMVVLPSGYILDATGPWLANGANNDAGILKAMLKTLSPNCEYFKPGDHNVLDRGFRDVINGLEEKGMKSHMPQLLGKADKQFTTTQGNESRRVTLVRWLVEAVNGRVKRKFKLFRNTIDGGEYQSTYQFFFF